MGGFIEPHRAELIAKVSETAERRLGADKAADVTAFICHYFAHVPLQDVHGETTDALFGAAYAHWKKGCKRVTSRPCVRVYNPRLDEHGWRSEHTVVEVVTDDMPFLVDSVTAMLNRRDLAVHLTIHPIVPVIRDAEGEAQGVATDADAKAANVNRESFMHFEVTQQPNSALPEIAKAVEGVLADVRAAVEDWRLMTDRMQEVINDVGTATKWLPEEDVNEVRAFLQWVHDDHFTFLGYREYAFSGGGSDATISVVPDVGLGVLRDPDFTVFHELRAIASMPPAVQAFVSRPDLLLVTKTNLPSTVHRPVPMDSIGVKKFDAEGRVMGQLMFVGLFTSVAYNRSPRDIPLLRQKLRRAVEHAGFAPRSHNAKALFNIVETFPRDELFQVSDEHLFKTSLGILQLQERQRVALFVRRDDFERFMSCLIYIPRDRYSTALRLKVQDLLERAFAGQVTAHYSQLGDSPLARLHLMIQTTAGEIPEFDAEELEAHIVDATRTWSDHLQMALIAAHGEEAGQRYFRQFGSAFPPGYEEWFNAEEAVADVDKISATLDDGELGLSLYRRLDSADHQIRLKVFHPDEPVHLSHVLPMLEHLGLRVIDEVPHALRVDIDGGRTVMIHDFGLETRNATPIDLSAVRASFLDVFSRVWRGDVESDGFNGLVLAAGLANREVIVLRACSKYLRQAGFAFSQAYMEQTLAANPDLTRLIVDLFVTLFDPTGSKGAEKRADAIRGAIAAELDGVESADEDRILRRFVNVVESTLRTNCFQADENGEPKSYLSFKIDSRQVDELPLPRPMVEVFVYSPRTEAVHLRGGMVARGGIRWSDRREDFRTEILGLMKAQMVKNAVIVPVGAKGGFIVKRPPPAGDREAVLEEGVGCYKTLMRGLLDITDNLVGGEVVPPTEVVRRDGDDPYLVVAADKGTATFSDIANGVSAEYGFWLGDAFASGGSQGYDHKGMGITARGAWESVKRHFREVGIDTQSEEFTVVGVGDMSGDVFGNGMLLSPHIKLLAAFNHMHIFVDPDPDAEASFAERQRMFQLPRSSWRDYDAKILSKGAQIYDRSAKSVTLTPEIKARFGFSADQMTPNTLIQSLLTAEVDLLWFGGIGTYVKAPHESHAQAGDRANDAVRVDATALRCKVIGEGANLGITQFGRIAFAQAGGRINTDFIDNSAGVDCSDHEVNIKILVDSVMADGDMTEKQRNALLTRMTDEVGELVLRDNYLQTQAISLIEAEAADVLDNHVRLMRMLERQGLLNRDVESLPSDDELAERAAARQGLTRPEISVLFSTCKMWLYDEILETDLPDDRHLGEDVVRYFPSNLRKKFATRIANHRLRRELIATSITNSLINRVGGTFVTKIAEETGMPAADITRAYIISRDVFRTREVWEQIEALDNIVPTAVQITLHREVQRFLERGTLWFLRSGGTPIRITENIAAFGPGVVALAEKLDVVLPDDMNSRIRFRAGRYEDEGVTENLALQVAYLLVMVSACDIVRIAADRGIAAESVARLYFEIGETLGFGWLRYQAEQLAVTNYWQKLAVAAVIDEFYGHQRDVALRVLDAAGRPDDGAIETWTDANRAAVDRARSLVGELQSATSMDLSMLTVASRQLRTLAQG